MYQTVLGAGSGVVKNPAVAKVMNNQPSQTELLTQVLGRRLHDYSARKLAKKLIDRFGSINDVLRISPARLAQFLGRRNFSAIEAIEETRQLLQALVENTVMTRPLLEEYAAVETYLRSFLSGKYREQFHMLMLDRSYCLLGRECLQVGTIDHVAIYPREVMATALSYNAASIILAHNHPGGSASPSAADIKTTKVLAQAGKHLGIRITDHIIIGDCSNFSFRQAGLLPIRDDLPNRSVAALKA